jgi:hypothetical protein
MTEVVTIFGGAFSSILDLCCGCGDEASVTPIDSVDH